MGETWLTRLLIIVLFVGLAKAAPLIGWIIVAVGGTVAILWLVRDAQLLPRSIMDVLSRLTNKAALEQAMQKKKQTLEVIDAAELAEFLKSRVIGQDAVCDEVAAHLRRRIAAKREGKPLAVFCFAGPPGVGKTYFAKVLAEKLYGNEKFLLFFDMSQYSQPHAAASMFGAARGYVGSNTYGALTAALRDVPSSVVLLDEFEKAHPEVHKRFLTAWNDGFVTEASDGAKISTSGAIFIATTNAAAKQIGELAQRFATDRDELTRTSKEALREQGGFAPEVLSRIDRVFSFASLEGLDVARVVALEIERLVKSYGLAIADGGIDATILIEAIDRNKALAAGGVRELARAIEADLADGLIDAKADGASMVRISKDGARVLVERVDEPPPADGTQPAAAGQGA